MSWDEALFRLAWKLKRGRRHAAAEPERQREARLADLKTSLTLVARALSGEALEVQEAEHVGGYAGEVIYLPRTIHLAPTPNDNARVYLYRVAYAVTSRQMGFTVPPTRRALESALPASQTCIRNSAPCCCRTAHRPRRWIRRRRAWKR